MTGTWFKNLDAVNTVGSVFIDFSNAFDTISHDILVSILSNIGAVDKLTLVQMLPNYTQCVHFNFVTLPTADHYILVFYKEAYLDHFVS